jgi:hypothetical protein
MKCFEDYLAEKRPGFFVCLELSRSYDIKKERERRCLSPIGTSLFMDVVHGHLFGCRDEADELVERGYEFLKLADALGEKQEYAYARGFSEGHRSTALSYLHWLRTGETDEEALADARGHFSDYFRRSKTFDRSSANLMAPTLLYLEAYDLVSRIADELSRSPGATARPGGYFGDVLRIGAAGRTAERDRLKTMVRKRMPLHLFRWLHRGHFDNVAFVLHAVFPRPIGPPSRLIETAWDHIPEIERVGGYMNWDVRRKRRPPHQSETST